MTRTPSPRSPLAIRPATAGDVPALHALVERAYRGESAKQGWTHEADLLGGERTDPASLAAMIAAPGEAILLAFAGAALAGCVHLMPAAAPGTAYLGLFAIAPDLQGGGLGKQLLAAAEDHAANAMAVRAIEMTVISRRAELIAFYERRGYLRTGETRPFPTVEGVIFREGVPLEMVVLEKSLAG